VKQFRHARIDACGDVCGEGSLTLAGALLLVAAEVPGRALARSQCSITTLRVTGEDLLLIAEPCEATRDADRCLVAGAMPSGNEKHAILEVL
jgi:hypothetical protein